MYRLLAACVAIAAALSIVATYPALSYTVDEPLHIACGLEWLQAHDYTYERQHPPLSRIAAAVGPWLFGVKNVKNDELQSRSPLMVYESISYERVLASARAGELPFFFLICWAVWSWSRALFSVRAAFLAVALLATTPVVLGHAGLATTDISVTCMLVVATYCYWRWLTEPVSWKTTTALGISTGLGLCSKFTFLVFFPLCALIVTAICWRDRERSGLQARVLHGGIAIFLLLLVMWGMYFGNADGFSTGVKDARYHQFTGHPSYLFGEIRRFGWWYFFPVVFLLKTPVPFLVAIMLALTALPVLSWRTRLPLLCAVALMISVLPTTINIGVRHILPIYPFLAIAAGGALDRLLVSSSLWKRVLVVGLVASQWIILAKAWPNYFAYFNFLAGGAPEKVRVDSDLDWGQDVTQLARWTKARGLQEPIGFAFFATADPVRHGLKWYRVSPWQPAKGWIAVSATELKMSGERFNRTYQEPWWSLKDKTPIERVGGTLIYYIP